MPRSTTSDGGLTAPCSLLAAGVFVKTTTASGCGMWERASSSRSSRATASSAIGAAKEAARDAGAALWASLMGDEMEAVQQREPMVECDDWGLYTRPWMVANTTTPVISVSILYI